MGQFKSKRLDISRGHFCVLEPSCRKEFKWVFIDWCALGCVSVCVCVRKRWGSGGNNSKRKFHAWAGQCIIFSIWYITMMHDNDFEKDKYFNLHFEPQYLQINRLFIKVKISFH